MISAALLSANQNLLLKKSRAKGPIVDVSKMRYKSRIDCKFGG